MEKTPLEIEAEIEIFFKDAKKRPQKKEPNQLEIFEFTCAYCLEKFESDNPLAEICNSKKCEYVIPW